MALLINRYQRGLKALRALGEKTKLFKPEFTTRVEDFSTNNLSNFDGLIFNNTTRIEKAFVTAQQRMALLDFIEGGKGFAGFHGASDAGMPKWPEYTDMIGGALMVIPGMLEVHGLLL